MNPVNCSVLIVDDDEIDRYILKRLLRKAQVRGEKFEASHGLEAIEFLADYEQGQRKYGDSFPPQAILLDINMQIMDGFQFLEAFAELSNKTREYRTIVFAMITSSERNEDLEKAKSYHCVRDYILKETMSAERVNELFHKKIDVVV